MPPVNVIPNLRPTDVVPSLNSRISALSWLNVGFVIGASLGVVCCSFGFLLMTDERVMSDLEDAENRSIRANQELVEAVKLRIRWHSELPRPTPQRASLWQL
jgi:hypothetical protein